MPIYGRLGMLHETFVSQELVRYDVYFYCLHSKNDNSKFLASVGLTQARYRQKVHIKAVAGTFIEHCRCLSIMTKQEFNQLHAGSHDCFSHFKDNIDSGGAQHAGDYCKCYFCG